MTVISNTTAATSAPGKILADLIDTATRVSLEDAIARLHPGKYIHTFMPTIGRAVVGAEMTREEVIDALKAAPTIHEADRSMSLGNLLAVRYDGRWLLIETI